VPPLLSAERVVDIDVAELDRKLAAHPFWYHTIDVAPGATTPGWFDLRHVVDDLPWPDVKGKRVLDIGTFDGFYAFEMERRGAAEVVAIDVEDHLLWDWPPDYRGEQLERDPGFAGPPKGAGFRLIAELTGSKAQWKPLSIYDLDPAVVGQFDVVVLGSLLLHLRDPIRALEAVRSVVAPGGAFLSAEQVEPYLSFFRNRPLFKLDGSGRNCQWWLANAAGHERMLFAAGFEVVDTTRPFVLRFNIHPKPGRGRRHQALKLWNRWLTKDPEPGVLHRAALCRVRV
jgi:tRNA (mo5U34)-methyltransferase